MENTEINIISLITNAINTLFSNLLSSIDNNLYSVLDDLLFIKTDIMNNSYLQDILGEGKVSGIILIANSLVIGFLIYYALSYLMSHFTFAEVQKPSQFIFRLLLCVISVNFAYFLCDKILFFTSSISLAIRDLGEGIFNHPISFASLITKLNSNIYLNSTDFNMFSLDGIIKGFISIGLINVALSYALRYVMIIVFILISPFTFLSLVLTKTAWLFKSWLKLFLSLLFLQILVPIILLVIFSLSSSGSDMFSNLTIIGGVYALIRANSYLRDFMGGLSTDVSAGISSLRYGSMSK